MTAIEKRNTKVIRIKAVFLTVIIYCSVVGGLLMYSGGGESSIPQKIKTFFQDNNSDQAESGTFTTALTDS